MSNSVVTLPTIAPHGRHIHAHGHDHSHEHEHEHEHGHAPAHGHVRLRELSPARPAQPAFSLLTLSLWQRLAGAAALSAILWLAVWWALI